MVASSRLCTCEGCANGSGLGVVSIRLGWMWGWQTQVVVVVFLLFLVGGGGGYSFQLQCKFVLLLVRDRQCNKIFTCARTVGSQYSQLNEWLLNLKMKGQVN